MNNNIIIIDLLHYVTDKIMNIKEDLFMAKLKEVQSKDAHLLICHFVENYCWGHYIYQEGSDHDLIVLNNLRNILRQMGIKYHFLFDALYEDHHKIDDRNDIIFANYSILLTYDYLFLKNNDYSYSWNTGSNKGLFLCGKGYGLHRAFLLRRIYEENLLERIEWSFNNSEYGLKHIRENFADYDDLQWQNFLNVCQRNLDLNNDYINKYDNFAHDGYPVDVSLYKNTSFSLISETLFTSPDMHRIGEKTWRAIANHHPFLMAGNFRNLLELRRMGFKAFDNYTDYPVYDLEKDNYLRLELIIKNIKTFDFNLKNNIDSVQDDIKHNFYKLLEYCRFYSDRIVKTLGVNETFISKLINEFKLR